MSLLIKFAYFLAIICGVTSAVSTNAPEIIPPEARLTVNVTSLTLSSPVSLICSIWNFEVTEQTRFTVAFHSRDTHNLATYSHDAEGKVILTTGASKSVLLHQGAWSSFPVFELIVTELYHAKQEFWCTFEEAKVPKMVKLESAHWPALPRLHFTAINGFDGERLGSCTIADFEAEGREFKVGFFAGESRGVLLGTYYVIPNGSPEFHPESVTRWSSIAHGENVTYPTFSIRARTTDHSYLKTWWCTLEVSGPSEMDEPTYYTSNEEYLNGEDLN